MGAWPVSTHAPGRHHTAGLCALSNSWGLCASLDRFVSASTISRRLPALDTPGRGIRPTWWTGRSQQLPCFGVWWISKRRARRRASTGGRLHRGRRSSARSSGSASMSPSPLHTGWMVCADNFPPPSPSTPAQAPSDRASIEWLRRFHRSPAAQAPRTWTRTHRPAVWLPAGGVGGDRPRRHPQAGPNPGCSRLPHEPKRRAPPDPQAGVVSNSPPPCAGRPGARAPGRQPHAGRSAQRGRAPPANPRKGVAPRRPAATATEGGTCAGRHQGLPGMTRRC